MMSSPSSETSSERSASSSPPQSPEASIHGPITLERLVVHFVAAKRSLSSTALVLRAKEIVTSSRRLIEEVAVLNAQNVTAQRGIAQQVDTLHAVRNGVAEVAEEADRDFESIITQLDDKHARLEKTLDGLRNVVVDAALHAKSPGGDETREEEGAGAMQESGEEDSPATENQKTLYDFIDDSTHTDLLSDLRTLLDTFQDSKSTLHATLTSLSDSTTTIEQTLNQTHLNPPSTEDSYNSSNSSNPTLLSTRNRDPPASTLPNIFRILESQAAEIASLLHSLISHHDLCVTALKHTEGGGSAAKAALERERETGGLTNSASNKNNEASLYAETRHPPPMSYEERSEMLSVLENDATELEEVVAELRDLATALEDHFALVENHVLRARSTRARLRDLLATQLKPLRGSLPTTIAATTTFRSIVADLSAEIADKSSQLSELTSFYAHFGASYKALLKEVERRKGVERQMAKVAERARVELGRLWEADREVREEFVEGVGRFLPRDLWPELGREGRRWVVRVVGEEGVSREGEGGGRIEGGEVGG